jgi:hypothetical protein
MVQSETLASKCLKPHEFKEVLNFPTGVRQKRALRIEEGKASVTI